MEDIVIVAAARTAVGKFAGSLAKTPAVELGATVIKALLERSKLDPAQVGEVILGQVLAAGCGQNPARQALMKSGLRKETPALTINAVCGSGLKSVMLAAQAVATGDSEIVIAGGQENMSASPHVLLGSRDGQHMGDWKMIDSMIVDGLWDVYNQYHMGITAENVAKQYGITREMQDALALASQQKAAAAQDAGRFRDEIVPVLIPQKKGDALVFETDEYVNRKTNAEALAGLRPAFDKAGGVTAGNASGINDGAAAVVVMSAKKAAALGLSARVLLPGFLPEPYRYIGHFDIFALSSDSEQFPISLVEAMVALAIMGFGNSAIAGEMRPTITTVDVDGRRIAREAIAAITSHQKGTMPAQRLIDVGFRIIARESA